MKISTRFRFAEIGKINDSLPDHDILRIIFLIERQNWQFIVKNIDGKSNYLVINTPVPFNNTEINLILDGTIPQVYKYGNVHIKRNSQPYEVLKSNETENYIELHSSNDFEGQLLISNYNTTGIFQNKTRLIEWFIKNSSLGNQFYKFYKYIDIDHFGNTIRINKDSYNFKLSAKGQHVIEGNNFKALMYFDESLRQTRSIRHKDFGELFNTADNVYDLITPITCGRKLSFLIELEDNSLEWFYGEKPILDNKFISKLKVVIDQILVSQDKIHFLDFIKKYDDYYKQLAANLLNKRVNKLIYADKLITQDGYILFQKPTCENEVVALYMKLEAAKLLPEELNMNIIEYTSKKGIDSLGVFQLSAISNKFTNAPIEFEYHLENYFEHDHPVEQTQLIICWDAYDLDSIEEIDEVNKITDWLIKIKIKTFYLPVLFLSKLPTFSYQKTIL